MKFSGCLIINGIDFNFKVKTSFKWDQCSKSDIKLISLMTDLQENWQEWHIHFPCCAKPGSKVPLNH